MLKKKNVLYSRETVDAIDRELSSQKTKTSTAIIFRKEALLRCLEQDRQYSHCHALPFWGYITSKGEFYTCSVFLGDERFSVGNIYENSMEEIFHGERRQCSTAFAATELAIEEQCRLNCRMARINEFLALLADKPDHINFI
jgi:GTP 3',8-cyclase